MMEWVKANPRPTAFILWGGAVFFLISAMVSCIPSSDTPKRLTARMVETFWGPAIELPPDVCAYYDSPSPSIEIQTSQDGRTWGDFHPASYVRFRASERTTVAITTRPSRNGVCPR